MRKATGCVGGFALPFVLLAMSASGAQNDWAEGSRDRAGGATRDYYNRAGLLAWQNFLGDWRDARNVPQGNQPCAVATLIDDDTPKWIAWDVTTLVRQWLDGTWPPQGFFLRITRGSGTFKFSSREWPEPAQRPQLAVTAAGKTVTLPPQADTHLSRSTYRSQGDADTLALSPDSENILLRFDLSDLAGRGPVDRAILRLYCRAQYGGPSTAAVFRCSQGHDRPPSEPALGLAWKYPQDQAIQQDPDVVFATGFESERWADEWTYAGPPEALDTVARDPVRKFHPLAGKALRVKMAQGTHTALNTRFQFRRETGKEPEAVFFRYYLRLADDWNQTVQGGKMPGISGTYGVAGWGGRKSHGTDGWSARGAYHPTIPPGNPLAGLTPIGTYCYHADMKGTYGDIWLWQEDYRGFLANNRWYCVEQYLKMNTPGQQDGVLRAWIDGRLAFQKTDIRFRLVDRLKIEQIWMNVYHGGKKPSPYDQHLYIDNVVIAHRYIGPMRPKP